MVTAGDVVIVSGPPGAGKTTLSAALADTFERSVHLESDWFFRFIRSGFIAPHLPASNAQNTAVMDIAIDAAAGYARAGNVVVWDGIVGPWFLDQVFGRMATHDIHPHYVVVRPDRDVGLERVRVRDGTAETSGAEVMWDQFADLGEYERHVIDSSGSIEDGVAEMLAALRDDALRGPRSLE